MTEQPQVALVTGASRGIGRSIANILSDSGYYVIGTATSDGGAQAISDCLGEQGRGVRLNLSEGLESIQCVLSELKAAGQSPAVLVNNAGITRDNLALRMKPEEWSDVISVNLTAAFQLSKLCLRDMMKARFGRIIYVGSIVGSMGNPGQINYCAAKAGVEGMAKSLAREVASRGITVNVVAPGFIETDMTKGLPQEQQDALLDAIPLARMGAPEDIAQAVDFLASDRAGYITGHTLHVNGGMLMD